MRRFGAYEILYELKSGGMGAVLLGRRRGPGAFEQLVAIKTILSEYAAAPVVRAMFLDEAAILARLNHPAVAHVHDFGEEGKTLYMAMEYVAGIAFRDVIELQPPPIVIARAIAEAARGLHAAHEARDPTGNALGLVHRDISPDNLMLGYDGHVKVIDFGIALVKNRQAPVTEFGTVKGKPPYMSPEQVANEAMDRRSDVFSLGVVLWELLTRRGLFEGDSIYAIALAVQQQAILPPSQVIGEALPYGLDAVVMNALDRELARRTPTAAAFAEELEQVIQAAGGESLEAWAARELAVSRDQHRTWLSSLATGATPLPRAIGRASGQHTEVAPVGGGPPPGPVAPVLTGTDTPGPGTSIGSEVDDDGLSTPPRRRVAPLVLLLLVLLGGGIALVIALTRHDATVGPRDAPPRPPTADAPAPDAEVVVPPLADAAISDASIDAPADAGGRHHPVPVDAGRPARDAAPTPVDAPAPPPPRGAGKITIRYKPGPFANIMIDGSAVPSPVMHQRIGAGPHTITFTDPQTGAVLDTQRVVVEDGRELAVTQN